MIPIADTSFIIAVANQADRNRSRCFQVYETYDQIYILEAALAEIAYMLRRESSASLMAQFFKLFAETRYRIVYMEPIDIQRTGNLIEQYKSLNLDFVDAAIVAVAERLKITTILTLDQRDFTVIRPRHADYFTLLPEPSAS